MGMSIDCWLLLVPATIIIGAGQLLTTNLNQIVYAVQFGSDGELVTSNVTLFSCAQSLSRLGAGILSDCLLSRGWSVPRPVLVILAASTMSVGHMLLWLAASIQSPVSMKMGTLLCGLAFGAIWPLMVVICSELFGSRRLSQNYMIFDGVAGALGTICFGKFLPAVFYNSAH